ncbi:putative proton glutamate symporter [Oscillibacter valericigenes Sjm18-20]|nr:putative proton glutamate symporter [Oscillibacter valericigenes Sjm18-20]
MSQETLQKKKKLSIPLKLAIALVLGVVAGIVFREKCAYIAFIGTVFIRLLKMCVYPLVLFSIISGVASVANIGRLKKIGGQFLLYTFISSLAAGVLGSLAITLTGAGTGLVLQATVDTSVEKVSMLDSIVEWVPSNVFESLSNGTLVQIIVFAIFFGVMITLIRQSDESVSMVAKVVEGCNSIMQKMVGSVMVVAPYGVFCLIANLVGTTGVKNLTEIFTMVLTMWGAAAVHILVLLPLLLKFFGHVSPIKFYRNSIPVILMAFSTQSSAATLPVTMDVSKNKNGVPNEIVDLCAAPAATINMDGAAIEYTIYTLFAAHAFGVHFSVLQIIFMIVLCVVCSAGAAGVPGGGIVMCSICLTTMGLPNEEITAMVAGVYVLLDIASTTLNVSGDCCGMVCIASRLGLLDKDKFNA